MVEKYVPILNYVSQKSYNLVNHVYNEFHQSQLQNLENLCSCIMILKSNLCICRINLLGKLCVFLNLFFHQDFYGPLYI